MRTQRRSILVFACVLALLGSPGGCTHAPPTLSPAGTAAFHALQVGRTLDIVRDVANDANQQTPKLVSNATLLKIVTWHEAAVRTIVAVPSGWRPTVLAGLDQLQREIPAAEWSRIAIYVALLKTVIAEVP